MATANQKIKKSAKAYDKLYDTYAKAVDANTKQQVQTANDTANAQLKQAYVTKMQDQRRLNQNLATAGIRGGATETSNLALNNQYNTARGTVQSNLANSIRDINNTANQNKMNYQQDMALAKRQYIENRQAENRANKREDKQIARNEAREDENIAYQRKQEKKEENYQKYTSKYSKYYSLKDLKKARKKAKTTAERRAIDERMGYIRAHKRGY